MNFTRFQPLSARRHVQSPVQRQHAAQISLLVFKDSNHVFTKTIDQPALSIGRSGTDDILLASPGVSRSHASIHQSANGIWLIDGDLQGRDSTNGLFVNGKRVIVHRLQEHDVITFCQDVYALFLTCPTEATQAQQFMRSLDSLITFMGKSDPQPVYLGDDQSDDLAIQKGLVPQPGHTKLDDLTGLPNRNAFLARVHKSLEFKKKVNENHQFAILFIDIDHFKMINESMGHIIGDKFLAQIAKKLLHCVRPNDTVARFGGDEFAIFIDRLEYAREAIAIAERIRKYFATPLRIEHQEVHPSLSIGIALSTLNYQSVEEIMRDADMAMYQAKEQGRGKFVIFDQEMHQKANDVSRLHNDLRRAIENKELRLFYQPIVALSEQQVIGFEALVRWQHPDRGLLSPDTFIPLAEETNLIYPLGQWVLEEACWQLSQWKANPQIQGPLSISVNLSSKQVMDASLVDKIRDLIQQYGLEPGELKLEVTETIVMENSRNSIAFFQQLKELGIQLAIDDFGTGYSSLSYLNRFPVDTLKVDRSFVLQIDDSDENTSLRITHSIIGLAHSLGVQVVAEGIEQMHHLERLAELQCDYGQGYLFSRPVPPADATKLAVDGWLLPT